MVETNSDVFSGLIQLVWVGVKAASQTLVQTKQLKSFHPAVTMLLNYLNLQHSQSAVYLTCGLIEKRCETDILRIHRPQQSQITATMCSGKLG